MPFREEMAKRHLKPTGDLGKVVFMVSPHTLCFLSLAHPLTRNMIFEIPPPLRKAFGIQTLFTISWEETTQPSTSSPEIRNAYVESLQEF